MNTAARRSARRLNDHTVSGSRQLRGSAGTAAVHTQAVPGSTSTSLPRPRSAALGGRSAVPLRLRRTRAYSPLFVLGIRPAPQDRALVNWAAERV